MAYHVWNTLGNEFGCSGSNLEFDCGYFFKFLFFFLYYSYELWPHAIDLAARDLNQEVWASELWPHTKSIA